MSAEIYVKVTNFVKIGAVETVLNLGARMKFYPYFIHLL